MREFLLFHTVAELFSVVIAWGMLSIAWNARRYVRHSFFALLGVAFASVGTIDLLHTLAYKGMGVFPMATANLPTQLWIAGRYVLAVSLLLAPLFLTRKVQFHLLAVPYAVVTAALIWSVFGGLFPDCYLRESGLTKFKVVSEYVICAIVAGAMFLLYRRREHLSGGMLKLLLGAMALTIAAEIAFTLYASVYGPWNLLGHMFKVAAFLLVYRAIIVAGLQRPYEALFRDLARSEERYRSLFSNMAEGFALHEIITDGEGRPIDYRFLDINPAFERLTGLDREEVLGRRVLDVLPGTEPHWIENYGCVALDGEPAHFENYSAALGRWYEVFAYQPVRGQFAVIFTDVTVRKRAEDELRASEQRYRLLFDRNPDGVFAVDPEGRFTDVNPACEQITGRPAEELLQMTFMDVCAPDQLEKTLEYFQRNVQERAQTEMETAVIRKDGKRVELWVSAEPLVVDDRVEAVHGTAKDITARKTVEDELRRLSHFPEENPNAVLRATPDGSVLYANEAATHWLKTMGWLEGALLPAPVEDLVGDADGHDGVIDREIANPEGDTFWLSAVQPAGETYVNIYGRDISARKRAERDLREREADLERAQTVGHIGSWRLDTRKNLLHWSDENYRIFGVPKAAPLTYETFLDTVHPDDREYVHACWKDGLRGRPYDIEHRIIVDGEVRWVHERANIEFDDAGNVVGGFGTTQDITDRKRAEEALRDINENLEQRVAERTVEVRLQAERLRALAGQLTQAEQQERKRLAKLVHDHIQQLIVAARMQLEWLKRDDDPARARVTAQGVDAILHEAFEATRSLSVDLSPPVLHESGLIGGLNWLAARMREKHRFRVNLRADNAAEPEDEQVRLFLFECVRELLFNAVKHAGVPEAQVTLARDDPENIRLTVSDKGAGFDPEALKNRGPEDASFGLFSVQERLAYVGGTMKIESAPGGGTTIGMTVPVAPLKTEPVAVPEIAPYAAREPSSSEAHRVLIVDDHEIMREGLRGLLEFEPDIEVVGEAADGARAVELAEKLEPDVVIMDVNLEGMGGVEATRQIVAKRPWVKVVGLSMHVDNDVAMAMRDAGAATYLTKGGPSEDLLAAIRVCATAHETCPAIGASAGDGEPNDHPAPSATGGIIRVVVADDYAPLRKLLSAELAEESDIEIVGEASSGEEAVTLARIMQPDVLVLDVSMPGMGGLEALRILREESPAVRVIGHSAHDETSGHADAMRAEGAVDCVTKGSSCEGLIRAIRSCMTE